LNAFALTIEGPGNVNFASQIIGSGGLNKNGTGKLTFLLGSNSTYSGATLVNSGIREIQNTSSLGATGAGNNTAVANGATLQLAGNVVNVPGSDCTQRNRVSGNGALLSAGGCNSAVLSPAPSRFSGNSTLSGNSGDTVTLNGAIGGARLG
jgi:autotransporter-associated beta strand protein